MYMYGVFRSWYEKLCALLKAHDGAPRWVVAPPPGGATYPFLDHALPNAYVYVYVHIHISIYIYIYVDETLLTLNQRPSGKIRNNWPRVPMRARPMRAGP